MKSTPMTTRRTSRPSSMDCLPSNGFSKTVLRSGSTRRALLKPFRRLLNAIVYHRGDDGLGRHIARRQGLLRGPLRALGEGQLVRDRTRLQRGQAAMGGGAHAVPAQGRAVELLAVLLGRGRRRRQPL